MEINHEIKPAARVGFKGYQHKRTDKGNPAYNFNFPYDSNHWDCYVEFYKTNKNENDFSYSVKKQNGEMKYFLEKQLTPGKGVDVDIIKDLKLKDSEAIAYRYRLVNKNDKNKTPKYAKDDDRAYCGDGCNLLVRKGTSVVVQGPMYLGIPDSFNPGYVFAGFHDENTGDVIKDPNAKDLSNFTRTFSNKAGGNIAGMMEKVPELRAAGYKRFIATPATGGDNVSSHKYWIKRANQTDNIDGYDKFQTELFKNGMNFVSDSAYTSQGLEGVNFQYAIKWMNQEDKPHEYYRFRMQGLEDAALGLGVVPKNMKNVRHKVVNSPEKYEVQLDGQIKISENKDYDPKQPTFIQIYDDSLVSDEQRKDTKNLITDYAKTNATTIDTKTGKEVVNNLAINTHDDTNVLNAFRIDPSEYTANIKNLNAINKNKSTADKIDLDSAMGTLIVGKFSGIEIRPKDEGGFVTWDANTDMAKLSYIESDYDTQMLDSIANPRARAIEYDKLNRAHAGNRDALTDTMRFWTKHVRNVNNEYTAKTLGKLDGSPKEIQDRINSLIYNRNNQQLPDDVTLSDDAVENIYHNDYKLRYKDNDTKTAIDKAIMEVPLDSIEFADDTVGALSSPYLTKTSPDIEHVGISRYDAMFDKTYVVPEKYAKTYNKMNDVMTKDIHNFVLRVLEKVDEKSSEKIFQNDASKLTEYGQYVVPLVTGDITKYAIIKSLVPDAESKELKSGKLTYDYEKLTKDASLESMGINGDSPEDEANQIVNKIKHGVNNLNVADINNVARSINERIENTNAMSFRFAEAMVEKSGLGLDHRIDAAKDVADMDAIRNKQDSVDHQLSGVIDIWEKPLAAVKEENSGSLILFEFTDLWDMMRATYSKEYVNSQNGDISKLNPNARLKNAHDVAMKILNEAGANSEANYDHFFTAGLNTFGKDFVSGVDPDNDNTSEGARLSLLPKSLGAFAAKSIDYKRNAYTFGGNHDKPRMAECFGMDMELFHADLNKKVNKKEIAHRKTAYMILNDLIDDKDLKKPNPKYDNKTGEDIINNSEDYFNNVSAKAIAKADWIRSSVGIANKIITEERLAKANNNDEKKRIKDDSNKIFAAYSKAIIDLVNGDYYLNGKNDNDTRSNADSYKKQLEKDGFGAMDVLTAFDTVTKQAIAEHDLQNTYLNNSDARKDFNQLFEETALGVPMKKVRMYTQMIGAIAGNPTVFAGDDFGMTGYEEKNHNVYLQNRNVIPWEVVVSNKDKNGKETNPEYREYIAEHKKAIDGIVGTRRDDINNKMSALNNGTMYLLDDMYGKNGSGLRCPAVLSQGADGSMNISVFNYNGISLEDPYLGKEINTRNDLKNVIDEKCKPVELDGIKIKTSNTNEKNIELSDGLEFRNVESSDPSYYKVCHENGNSVLKRVFKEGNGKERYESVWITGETAPEGVLRLYYQPKEVTEAIDKKKELEAKYTKPVSESPSFKGKREYYNPQYNIANAGTYETQPQKEQGNNLSIMSE